MKKLFLAIVASTLYLTGCGILPIEAKVEKDHFRFENFENDIDDEPVYAFLLCYKSQPTFWNTPKQYEAGEHNLWVKAYTYKRGVRNSVKQAITRFDISLNEGKSYALKTKLDGKNIDLWIQESDSGEIVSEVVTKKLEYPLHRDDLLNRKRCVEGSI